MLDKYNIKVFKSLGWRCGKKPEKLSRQIKPS